ncbi:TPA: hypothetical protein QCK11_002185 [Enterobacter asburiae]|nr:hypothetical protein [Enterobacter asburiae]
MALCKSKNFIIDEVRFKINQLLHTVEFFADQYQLGKEYTEKLKDIKLFFSNNNKTLYDLFYTEKMLIGIATESCLRKYYKQLTERYIEVLPKEAKKYIYPNEITIPQLDLLREETLYIAGLLHNYYNFLDKKEKTISKYKLLFIILLLIMIAILGVAFLFSMTIRSLYISPMFNATSDTIIFIIAMLCSGYFGGVISIVRRIQNIAEKSVDGVDREDLILKLINGKWGIFLSVLLGTLSPFVLLLVLFIFQDTEIKIGDFNVLPRFCNIATECGKFSGHASENSIMSLLSELTFKSKKDIAEFFLLSIACGFSERFIPDVLDRVSKELDNKIKTTASPTSNTAGGGDTQG